MCQQILQWECPVFSWIASVKKIRCESCHPGSKWYCNFTYCQSNIKQSPLIDIQNTYMKHIVKNESILSDENTSVLESCKSDYICRWQNLTEGHKYFVSFASWKSGPIYYKLVMADNLFSFPKPLTVKNVLLI